VSRPDPSASAGEFSIRAKSAAAWVLLLLVRFYIAFLSPFFGGACRFYPSCSNYAAEAIARHGARRGATLAARRLIHCNPFTKGGFDPVPDELASAPAVRRPQARGDVQ
jgi:putative membrane protein insertion efficiency factor